MASRRLDAVKSVPGRAEVLLDEDGLIYLGIRHIFELSYCRVRVIQVADESARPSRHGEIRGGDTEHILKLVALGMREPRKECGESNPSDHVGQKHQDVLNVIMPTRLPRYPRGLVFPRRTGRVLYHCSHAHPLQPTTTYPLQ